MKTGDKLVLIVFVVSIGVAIWAHFDAHDDCLAMIKPKTDSTQSWREAKFTGEYKRRNGVLYCIDTNGVEHSYRNITL